MTAAELARRLGAIEELVRELRKDLAADGAPTPDEDDELRELVAERAAALKRRRAGGR